MVNKHLCRGDVATFHPSYVLRKSNDRESTVEEEFESDIAKIAKTWATIDGNDHRVRNKPKYDNGREIEMSIGVDTNDGSASGSWIIDVGGQQHRVSPEMRMQSAVPPELRIRPPSTLDWEGDWHARMEEGDF